MTNDFSKYSHIIQQFRGKVSTKGFEQEFATATEALVTSERFLLKMELKRLAQPCTRLIDLRGHVDGECILYQDDNRSHYLDDVAIEVFEENMALYGHYCFGVYEASCNTENNFKVMYQKESALNQPQVASSFTNQQIEIIDDASKPLEKLQCLAKSYSFNFYVNRSEERMNFAIPLELLLEDKRKILCTSSDLSSGGCKFRLPKNETLYVGQLLHIRFVGLEQEFAFDAKEGYPYCVSNVHFSNGLQTAGVKRIYENGINDGFKTFLDGFIQGNKRRYRINLTNTIKAFQSRMFEQFLVPSVNELPIFFSKLNNQYVPHYGLTTSNNRNTFEYWLNEKKESTLHYLFTLERMTTLLKSGKQSISVYSFIHKHQNKLFFYTADESQFGDNKVLFKQFISFAVQKASFAVFNISLNQIKPDNGFSSITIPNTANLNDAPLNVASSDEVISIIEQIKLMGVVSDLTSPELIKEIKKGSIEQAIDIKMLKTFGHKRIKLALPVEAAGITYSNDRNEPRFTYKTPVVISVDGVKWEGTSENFSISGLKIDLKKRSVLQEGDVVYLSFPKLQKITKSFELNKLPYEIVRINKAKNILNLKVYVQNHRHIGRAFFKLLIDKNKDKLASDEYLMMTRGLLPALRNIFSYNIASSTVFIQTSGSRYKLEAMTAGTSNSRLMKCLKQLSDDEQYYNLYPLFKNNIAADVLSHQLKQQQVSDCPYTNLLFIAVDHNKTALNEAIDTRLVGDFESFDQKQKFIQTALKKGSFFCVQFKLSRTGEPNLVHLNPELSYISAYALHKGKQLEKDIYSVAGFVQLYDVTEQVVLNYS